MSRGALRLGFVLIMAILMIGVSPSDLLLIGCGIALWLGAAQRDLLSLVLQRIARLKWFYLAIGLLYLLGQPQGFAGALALSSWLDAAYRVGILVVLVSLVSLSLHGLPPAELAGSLRQLLRPLGFIGIPVDRFSRRLALTLDAVAQSENSLRQFRLDARVQANLDGLSQLCLAAEQGETAAAVDSEPPRSVAAQPRMMMGMGMVVLAVLILRLL